MDGYPWTIHKSEVRCPCGSRFENAEMYLRHKVSCMKQQEETSIRSQLSGARRKAPPGSTKAPMPAPSLEFKAFHPNKPSKSLHTIRSESVSFSARKQQPVDTRSTFSPGILDVGFESLSIQDPISPSAYTKRIHCACGRTFAEQAALNMHLQTSKAHRAQRIQPGEGFISLTSDLVQPATVNAPPHPPQPPPAFAPMPGTISYLTSSVPGLLHCTCGQSYETQRILDLHKRDSLYHQRHPDDFPTLGKHQENSPTPALVPTATHSQPTKTQPTTVNLKCICGCVFSTQGAFDQHNTDAARYAWLNDREARNQGSRISRVGR
jgi:hypothetical protein